MNDNNFDLPYSTKTESFKESHTRKIGSQLATVLDIGSTVYLVGELGTGKTILTQGITKYFNCSQTAKSPTFILISTYEGKIKIHHCDFYRINNSEEVLDLPLEEYLQTGVLVIEWPDRAPKYLPKPDILVNLNYSETDGSRIIKISTFHKELMESLIRQK